MSNRTPLSTVEILSKLVSFDTTSRNSNLALIGWVRDYLAGYGVHCRESRDEHGGKANLHAIVGPVAAGGIALSGHVDTVPVDGQDWHSEPFALTERDGRLLARGSTDMKGFVASMLAAVPDLVERGSDVPVHLFITFNEEVDCAGARRLMRDIDESGLRPAYCIVGEPSSLRPISAHKGRLSVSVHVRGKAVHSSDPGQGVNALQAAARAVAWLADEADRMARDGRRVDGFDPAWSTTQCGLFTGGAILNIVPEQASFDVEWRTVPGDDAHAMLGRLKDFAATLEPAMRAVEPSAGFRFELHHELPPLALPDGHRLADLVMEASGAGANRPGSVSYGTEAGIFERSGIASIVCGPGDIARAHKADEWIGRDELEACDGFIRRAVGLAARALA
jgi:acetylornithine deacetylase